MGDAAWMLELSEFEFVDASARRSALTRGVECAQRALVVLREHASNCEVSPSETIELDFAFEGEDDGLDASTRARSGADTSGIAFVASFAVRARQDRLLAADVDDRWEVLVAVDGLGRELRRTLAATERALGSTEVDAQGVLDALQVRRSYVRFADAVGGAREPRDREVLARLRLTGAAIVKLVGDDAYRLMRAGDRRVIRAFHDRILGWIRSGSADAIAGLRLWRDVATMVELILGINNRPELAAHDAEVLRACMRLLEQGEIEACYRRASGLVGRDGDLDRRIREGGSTPELKLAMRRVLDGLTRPGAGTGVRGSGLHRALES